MKNIYSLNLKSYSRKLLSTQFCSLVFCLCFALVVYAQTDSDRPSDGNYKIGAGDILKVLVTKNEMLSIDDVRVNNNGTIRLPMIDSEIQANCLTEAELATVLTAKYKKYLLNPQVYVAVKEFNSNSVAVVGEVVTPGRFQIKRPTRLLELITYVNGASPNAGRNVQIIRSLNVLGCKQNTLPTPEAGEDQEVITLPLAETLKGNEVANPFVQPGDVVRITTSEQAFIIGNVKSAMTINLKEPVTLSKAIAIAGGLAPEAQSEKIKIMRQEVGSLSKTELIVSLKDINKQKQPDVLLQANDIIDVPGPSATRKFFRDIIRSIVPSAARVPMVP